VPVPTWAKLVVDEWTDAASISAGPLFRRVGRLGKIWGTSLTPKAILPVVKTAAKRADIKNLAPHDSRRTCARLCHLAGGELEQIQFLLGHASVQTTEHYLGCKQKLRHAVNDNLSKTSDQAPTSQNRASSPPCEIQANKYQSTPDGDPYFASMNVHRGPTGVLVLTRSCTSRSHIVLF
jgi:hypothetical protein